jgi:hypothetical protein
MHGNMNNGYERHSYTGTENGINCALEKEKPYYFSSPVPTLCSESYDNGGRDRTGS